MSSHALATPLDKVSVVTSGPVCWVIDQQSKVAYRFEREEPPVAVQLGESAGGAAVLSDGTLVLNTPMHPTAAFRAVAGDGTSRRFGARRNSPVAALDALANEWVLAVLAGDQLVAVHAFDDVTRIYRSTGDLSSEFRLRSSTVSRLLSRKAELEGEREADPSTCCIRSADIRFASEVSALDSDRFLVRFGAAPQLEAFSAGGELRAVFALPARLGSSISSLTLLENGILGVGQDGLMLFPRQDRARATVGRVLGRGGRPLKGAKIQLRDGAGQSDRVVSDEAGRFSISGHGRDAAVVVRVAAVGYLDLVREGALAEVIGAPFQMEPAPQQCVAVSDAASGKPLHKFRLSLVRSAASSAHVSREEGREMEVESSEDGRACVVSSFAPPWSVRVVAAGFAEYETPADPELELDVRMQPEARLAIRVVGRDGPAAEATIDLRPSTLGERGAAAVSSALTKTTDGEGGARFDGLAEGAYRVKVTHPGHPVTTKNIELTAGDNDLDLALEKGSRVNAVVTALGNPVPGARVQFDPQGQILSRELVCTTGDDGQCSVEGVPDGAFRALAAAPGYARRARAFAVAAHDTQIALDLRQAVEIRGTIQGLEQYGSMRVSVVLIPTGASSISVPVAADHTFTANDMPAGTLGLVVQDAETKGNLVYERVEVPSVPQYEVTVRMPPPFRLTGSIRRGGSGCSSCEITFDRSGVEAGRTSGHGMVAPDGRYEARLPGRGRYVVTATHPASGTSAVVAINVESDLQRDIELSGALVALSVIDADGAPAAEANVVLTRDGVRAAESTTGADGKAQFQNVNAGQYVVSVSHRQGAASKPIDVADAPVRLEIQLPRQLALRLRVLGGVQQMPMPYISARVIQDEHRALHQRLYPDADGVFTIPLFARNAATVVIVAPGQAVETIRGLTPSEAPQSVLLQPYTSFEIEVDPQLRPCGFEVRNSQGLPISLSVEFDPGPVPLVTSKALFNRLRAGSYTATLVTCDNRRHTRALTTAVGTIPIIAFTP